MQLGAATVEILLILFFKIKISSYSGKEILRFYLQNLLSVGSDVDGDKLPVQKISERSNLLIRLEKQAFL